MTALSWKSCLFCAATTGCFAFFVFWSLGGTSRLVLSTGSPPSGIAGCVCLFNSSGQPLRNARIGDFVYDDVYAIVQNPDVYSSAPWPNLLKNDFWGFPLQSEKSHKSFRPLTTLTFRIQMSKNNDSADKRAANMMHLANVLLHSVNTALLVPLYRKLGFTGQESLIATTLFACHPVHVEAVANLVGRAELLAAFFSILSILLWSPSNILWPFSLLLASFALLCKETAAVVALPMCSIMQILACLSMKKPSLQARWKAILPLMLLLLLLVARVSMHGGSLPFLHRESNPGAFAADVVTRVLTLHFYACRLDCWWCGFVAADPLKV